MEQLNNLTPTQIVENFKKDLEDFKNAKVKCAIIGRSGTGKSSLINAIVGEEIAKVGEVETTKDVMEIEHKGFLISDLPGCGTDNFQRDEYMEEFEIEDYDCVILVTSDRFYEDDLFLIDELTKIKKPTYAVRTKIDFSVDRGKRRDVSEEETLSTVREDLETNLAGYRVEGIYLTSSDLPTEYDLSELLEDIYSSLKGHQKQRFLADISITSEAVLQKKRELVEKIVSKYSTIAAANGLNPIPCADIAVDLGLLVKMSNDVKDIYGLNEKDLSLVKQLISKEGFKSIGGKVSQYAVKYGGKQAIMAILKRMSASVATKSFSKWIPFVGQAVAAGIGFKMTSSIGKDMINDAEEVAQEILNSFKKSV